MESPRIGLYLRLSRDDEREGESQSITNQRRQLLQYVRAREWAVTEEYSDDGYTGTNFDRPAFQRLLEDIEAKKIDTVITKDLSRLGRDQIMTAYYYQIYFPLKKVRYIAVAEGFDTADGGAGNALFPFLTAANDFYTADISRKVRSALTARIKEGKFIGSEAPLGYQKDPQAKGHLVLDPAGAEIIRTVFRLYQSLGSIAGTARALTQAKVPTPAEYRSGGPAGNRFPGVWSGETVRRILTNPTYTGDLTQHRTEKISYKIKQRVALPPERWIVIPGTHEPIIGRGQFEQVQEMIRVRGYHGGKRGNGHLLTGLAFCADCGSPMTYVRESPTRTYMVCQGYRKGGRLQQCTPHRVREDRVIAALREQLCLLGRGLDQQQFAAAMPPNPDRARLAQRLRQAEQRLEERNRVLDCLYRDRAAGRLSEEEFEALFARAKQARQNGHEEAQRYRARLASSEEPEDRTARVQALLNFEPLDRGLITALVRRVLVSQDKTIEIQFRFRPPVERNKRAAE